MSTDTVIETVRARLDLVVSERIAGMPSASGHELQHTSFPFEVERLEADLDDPDQHAAEELTFAGSPITVDLTNVLGLRGRFSAVGRGLVALRIIRLSGTGDLEIDMTDTNGYAPLNAGNVLTSSGLDLFFFGEPLSAISSTSKLLVCTGTSGAVWGLEFVFGESAEPAELPTADAHMRVYHGTHKPFSETFAIPTANWAGAMAYEIFTIWRGLDGSASGGPGDDAAVINPADLAELESGETTDGAGTYTMKEMLEHAFDRLLAAHPDQKVGLYMAGGYVFAPQYLYDGYQFLSVYPKGHVRWTDDYLRTGGATGFAVSAAAISSMADDGGGFLEITFAAGQTIPTGSIIDIAGTTEAAYNVTGALVTSGATISSGGGDTATVIVTDVPWVGAATGGTVTGGARKIVDWTDDTTWERFLADMMELWDENLASHPRVSVMFLDEVSHPQVSGYAGTGMAAMTWEARCARLDRLQDELHARGTRLLPNVTWHFYSASQIVVSDNSGTGGRLRVQVASLLTAKVGDVCTISGHTPGTANVTAAIYARTGRIITLDTLAVGGGTISGTITNDSIAAEDLAQTIAAVDGLIVEGYYGNDVRYKAASESLWANRRTMLDAGLALIDIPQATVSTFVISGTTSGTGGRARHAISSGTVPLHGSRIGVYGSNQAAYNEIQYVVRVADDNTWIETSINWTADGTGATGVYTNLGSLVAIDSVDNTGAGAVVRLHCDTDHHIFPQEGTASITVYGPAGTYGALSGASYVPLAVAGQSAKVDLTGETDSFTSSARGYLVDTTRCRRNSAIMSILEYEVGDRTFVDQDDSILPTWDTWAARLGAPAGDAVRTYGTAPYEWDATVTRTFANGTVEYYPNTSGGYGTVTIGGTPE